MTSRSYVQTYAALGSKVEFCLVTEEEGRVAEWFHLLETQLGEFEARFSRFRADSELSRLNAQAGEKVAVSSAMHALLEAAYTYAERSGGLFNPFVLPQLEAIGYAGSLKSAAPEAPHYADRQLVSYRELELGDGYVRIPADSALDLGGIGKGYLADQLGTAIAPHTTDVCLSLGGDLFISGANAEVPWTVEVESATAAPAAVYSAPSHTSYGIATSGLRRTVEGRVQAHQIDPRSGAEADSSYTRVTVAAPSATAADVFASCVLLGGTAEVERLMHLGLVHAVLLQPSDGSELQVYGDGFTLL